MLPGQRGFTRRNLFRMRQFHDVYRGDEKVTPLVTQLPDKKLLAAKLHEFYGLTASAPGKSSGE